MKLTTLTSGALRSLYRMLGIFSVTLRINVALTPTFTKGELKPETRGYSTSSKAEKLYMLSGDSLYSVFSDSPSGCFKNEAKSITLIW